MKRLLLPLLAAIALPNAVEANWLLWGLSKEEKAICRDRASRERNEFSAKQTYNYCSKNIKSELKDKERKKKEREINYQRWYEEVGKNGCDKEKRELEDTKNRIENNPTPLEDWEFDGRIYKWDKDALLLSRLERELFICKRKLEDKKSDYGL